MASNDTESRVGDMNVQWGKVEAGAPAPLLDNVDNLPLAEQTDRFRQDTAQRLFLAKWVVWVSSIWLGAVLAMLSMCGLKLMELGDTVLGVLLATTTVNVLGLAYIVLKGLFGQSGGAISPSVGGTLPG